MASTSSDGVNKYSRALCSFTGCNRSKARYPELRFFSFPVNRPALCDVWITNCANEALHTVPKKTLNRKVVCEKHFEDDCFLSTLKTRLHACAIPTILSLPEIDDAPRTAAEQTAQEPNPIKTPSESVDQERVSAVKTPIGKISELPVGILNEPANSEAHSRRALFLSPRNLQSNKTPQSDPSTPRYKKFKSIKGRQQTPRKVMTPSKRKLLSELNSLRQQKRILQQKVKRLQNKKIVITKDTLMAGVKSVLPAKVSNFVCMQLKHANKKKMPWTEEEKLQALALRYKSPALYDQMRSDEFALPSPSTIARWLQAVDLRPGVCPEILKMVTNKVKHMAEWEKNAVIMFDEMSIKSSLDYDSKRDLIEGLLDLGEDGRKPYPATHVLLFMARGLTYRWKMPIAFFATNQMVNASLVTKLVEKCILALRSTGMKVRAVVCDQSSVNRKAAKLLQTSKQSPFFEINGEKVFLIYDFPHVVKCLRNNLMKKKNGCFIGQMVFEKETSNSYDANEATSGEATYGVADWAHVQMLHSIDSGAVKSRATKLTDKHVAPNSFEKMSVKLATQVFSLSVSAAMRTAVETGQLPSSALDTAYFLERINNTFDVMNSKNKFNVSPYKCAISSSLNSHLSTPLTTLVKDINWAKSLRMRNDARRPPCMDSLEHTLLATKMLWDDMKADGAQYLMTGRLNQDPIENEFSVARQKCGFERNPSVRMFRQNLRHRIQAALVQPPAGANCEPDQDELLSSLTAETEGQSGSLPGGQSAKAPLSPEEGEEHLTPDSDCDEDNDEELGRYKPTLEACSVRYFTGYGVRCTLKQFKCDDCRKDLIKPTPINTATCTVDSLIRNKEYQDDRCHLIYPTDETTAVVDIALGVLDEVLKSKINIFYFKKNVLLKSKRRIFRSHPEWMKCGTETECYKHREFLIDKIVTAKIKRTLQAMSRDLRQPGGKYGGHWEKMMKLKNK